MKKSSFASGSGESQDRIKEIVKSLIPLATMLVILAIGMNIIFFYVNFQSGLRIDDIWYTFFVNTLGSSEAFQRTMMRTAHILTITLGLMVAFRSGVWNAGSQGQVEIGAIVSTGVCLYTSLPGPLRTVSAFLLSFVLGGIVAGFIGFAKSRLTINEVFIGIMTSFIFTAAVTYLTDGPWREVGVGIARSHLIVVGALPFVWSHTNAIVVIALALIPVMYVFLNMTRLGYEIRLVGAGRKISLSQGLNVGRNIIISMFISGGLCAIAGGGIAMGEIFRLQGGMTGQYGWMAMPAALMSNVRPEFALPAAFFIGVILQGSLGLTTLGINARLGEAIVGLVFIVSLLATKVAKQV